MLVLSRSKGDAVVIGDITVEVVEIRGDKVRLSVKAPLELPIHGSEVFDAAAREPASPATQPATGPREVKRVSKQAGERTPPLILGRKKNESIVINNDITIIVVEIHVDKDQSKVRLGVEAPKEVPVHRKEVWDAIMREYDAQS